MDDALAGGAPGGSMAGGAFRVTALLARGAQAGSGGAGLLASKYVGQEAQVGGWVELALQRLKTAFFVSFTLEIFISTEGA